MSEHDRHTDEADIARNYDGPRRSAHTEQLIADARGPVKTPPMPPTDLVISLEGEGAAAYEEFRLAARDLSAHQAAGPALLERYRVALARLSAAAVK